MHPFANSPSRLQPVFVVSFVLRRNQSDTTKRAMGSDLTDYTSERRTLEALAWTSVAFFIVEVLGREKKEKRFLSNASYRIDSFPTHRMHRIASHRLIFALECRPRHIGTSLITFTSPESSSISDHIFTATPTRFQFDETTPP